MGYRYEFKNFGVRNVEKHWISSPSVFTPPLSNVILEGDPDSELFDRTTYHVLSRHHWFSTGRFEDQDRKLHNLMLEAIVSKTLHYYTAYQVAQHNEKFLSIFIERCYRWMEQTGHAREKSKSLKNPNDNRSVFKQLFKSLLCREGIYPKVKLTEETYKHAPMASLNETIMRIYTAYEIKIGSEEWREENMDVLLKALTEFHHRYTTDPIEKYPNSDYEQSVNLMFEHERYRDLYNRFLKLYNDYDMDEFNALPYTWKRELIGV